MSTTRRTLLAAGISAIAAGTTVVGLVCRRLGRTSYDASLTLPVNRPEILSSSGSMPYRRFGATGLKVSEVSFGAWAIGGQAYGSVDRQDSLRALARAEELGCNLVDTAMVYGDSEVVLGEFLRGRRSRWIVATKYSFQQPGMTATLDKQLQRLQTDAVDFYQLHSMPTEERTLDELYKLKKDGKVRFIGVSLYTAGDIDRVLRHAIFDGIQLRLSLLDPDPFLLRRDRLQHSRLAVLIRSTLKEGFLAGKFKRTTTFPEVNDQRHGWSAAQIARTVDEVERFRFLEAEAGSMVRAAVAYPLSFPEVSTVLLGTKNLAQAESNFGQIPGARLSQASLRRVLAIQDELDLGDRQSLRGLARRALGRV